MSPAMNLMLVSISVIGTPAVEQWSPVHSAITLDNAGSPPDDALRPVPLLSGDEYAAKISLNGEPRIRVSVLLGADASYAHDASLSLQLRELSGTGGEVPGDVVSGSHVSLSPPNSVAKSTGWYSAVIDTGVPLTGEYWVCLLVHLEPTTPESLSLMMQSGDFVISDLTWDHDSQRYLERGGLWYSAAAATWTDNAPDPYIRVRYSLGENHLPEIVSATVSPTGMNLIGSPVQFNLVATDEDGPATLTRYRWSYQKDGDPSRIVLQEGDITAGDISGNQAIIDFEVTDLEKGAYRFFAEVSDVWGDWRQTPCIPDPEEYPGYIMDAIANSPLPQTQMEDLRDNCGTDLCAFMAKLDFPMYDQSGELVTEIPVTYSVRVIPGTVPVYGVKFYIEDSEGGRIRVDTDYEPDIEPPPSAGLRYRVTFNTLGWIRSGTYTIFAEAQDAIGNPLAITSKTFTVMSPPDWYYESEGLGLYYVGEPEATWYANDGKYDFDGNLPYDVPMFEQEQWDIPLMGSRSNKGSLVFSLDEDADQQETVSKSGYGSIWTVSLSNGGNTSSSVSTDGEGNFSFIYHSPTVRRSGTLYDAVVFGAAIGPIVITVHLTIDYLLELMFHVCADFNSKLQFQPVCLVPELDPSFNTKLQLDLMGGLGSAGVESETSFGFEFPVCYHYNHDPRSYVNAYASFDHESRVYGCVGWGSLCAHSQWYRPPSLPWTYSNINGPQCAYRALESADRDDPPTEPLSPFASPRIATDSAGNSLAVWIHDDNYGSIPPNPDPDVYYAYKPAGGVWQQPAPVDTTNLFETDPRVTFLSDGVAMLVLTQNQMTQQQAEQSEADVILAEQELVYYTFIAPNVWTPRGKVHNDGGAPQADGRAELCTGPYPFPSLVWVRSPDLNVNDPCNTDIMYSSWNGTAWEPMMMIGGAADEACHIEPNVAIDSQANVLAVWVRDDDGVRATGDRVVEARYFSATSGTWGNAFEAVNSEPGVLWSSAIFDSTDSPVIVFTARGENNNQHPSGQEYGEGIHDFLRSASRAIGTPPDAEQPFEHIESVGGPYQNRVTHPRLCGSSLSPQPLAFVAARTFPDTHRGAYEGEVGITVKALSDGASTGWPKLSLQTQDESTDWQIDAAVDPVANVLQLVWVKPDTHVPPAQNPPFGKGFDAIQFVEIPMGVNLSVEARTMGASPLYAMPGENVELTARITNTGLEGISGGLLHVDFYLDQIGAGHLLSQHSITDLAALGSVSMTTTWVSDGLSHELIVVVDPENAWLEANESDNTAALTMSASPAPSHLTLAANLSAGWRVDWDAPDESDPAAPPAANYRVYRRDDPDGNFEMIAETPGTVYYDQNSTSLQPAYKVTAVTYWGGESDPAGPVTGHSALDCNANGLLDTTETDHDQTVPPNGVPDECEGSGDVDFDCVIGITDWDEFAQCMQGPGSPYPQGIRCIYLDMDCDEDVDLQDATIFFSEFGAASPACSGPSRCGGRSLLIVKTNGPHAQVTIPRNPLWQNDTFTIDSQGIELAYRKLKTVQLALDESAYGGNHNKPKQNFLRWRINGVLQPMGQQNVSVTLDPLSRRASYTAEAIFDTEHTLSHKTPRGK